MNTADRFSKRQQARTAIHQDIYPLCLCWCAKFVLASHFFSQPMSSLCTALSGNSDHQFIDLFRIGTDLNQPITGLAFASKFLAPGVYHRCARYQAQQYNCNSNCYIFLRAGKLQYELLDSPLARLNIERSVDHGELLALMRDARI